MNCKLMQVQIAYSVNSKFKVMCEYVLHTLNCSGIMTVSSVAAWFTSIQPKAELAVREVPSNSMSASSPPPADHLAGKVYQSIRVPPLLPVVDGWLSCDVDGRGCPGWKEGEAVVGFVFVASVISLSCDACMNKIVQILEQGVALSLTPFLIAKITIEMSPVDSWFAVFKYEDV